MMKKLWRDGWMYGVAGVAVLSCLKSWTGSPPASAQAQTQRNIQTFNDNAQRDQIIAELRQANETLSEINETFSEFLRLLKSPPPPNAQKAPGQAKPGAPKP